jgi:glycosyltransferase involved in cell wall biosynthesis
VSKAVSQTSVLLVAGVPPRPAALTRLVARLRAQGARVGLAGAIDPERLPPDLWLNVIAALPPDAASAVTSRADVGARGAVRVWRHLRRRSAVHRLARRAELLVALDPHATYAVQRLALRNPGAAVAYGTDAQVVPGASPGRVPYARVRRLALALIRLATARPVLRSRPGAALWLATVCAPGLPDGLRTALAYQVAAGMAWADRAEDQGAALRAAAAAVRDQRRQGRLRGEAAARDLAAGAIPDDLAKTVADLLVAADRGRDSAEPLDRALGLAFHRVLHVDDLTSPLATDPEGFTAPLRRSSALTRAIAPRGRAAPAAPPPRDRPLRLLIASGTDDKFLALIRAHYAAHPGVELRYLDVAADPELYRLAGDTAQTLRRNGPHRMAVERRLRPHLDWADTVLIEWCVAPAAMFTLVDPGTTRIVVRLHSYEALTRWPYHVDFSRVDDLVFVAAHIRDLVNATTEIAGTVRQHLLHNAMDLRAFRVDKAADARFTLGLVGLNQVAKDPRWAVEVLRLLHARDDRYRLVLVGPDLSPHVSAAARAYRAALDRDLAAWEPSGAVQRLGPTDDVPKALAGIGVILSSSVREGCHCALMEGAASGAVPVVRDWPFFAGRPNGARTLFPDDWVVPDQAAAVERILATTATDQAWRATGRGVADHALSTWDWSVVRGRFDRLLLHPEETL